MVAGCNNNHVVLYDVERKRVVESVDAHHDDINAVCYADSAYTPHLIVSGSDDTTIKVWDRRTMSTCNGVPAGILAGHTEGITHVTGRGELSSLGDPAFNVLQDINNGSVAVAGGRWQCLLRWSLAIAGGALR